MTVSHRQTRSYLMKRFEEVGIRPKTRHGQNFLIDLNLIELLFRSAQVDERDVVLEVGTGTGSLTAMLAQDAAHVVTVEIDSQLFQLAREQLEGLENLTMLRTDILKNKNLLAAEVMETVSQKLSEGQDRRLKLVSNLPYNVATPILSNLLACELPPHSMTVTIQKELADRITAGPGTKDYGALSVWIQSQCQAKAVRILPPEVFWPRPKVSSAIIHVELDPAARARIPDLHFFHRFARAMFFHRRKYLRSVAQSAFKQELSKPDVDQVLESQGLDGTMRAEQLSVQQMLKLSEAFRERVADL